MKTKFFAGTAMCLIGTTALAGGLFTNTNQNPIFFRQPAQNANIGVQGSYYNPAGLALMNDGLHFSIGYQMAIQERTSTSTYAPFAYNADRPGQQTVKFEGKAFSPVIPSLDLSYNKNKWAASFHFGFLSGGGSCKYDNGLGSFESKLSLPILMSGGALEAYKADINFKGKTFGMAGQFNYSYRLIDKADMKLAVAAGLRLNYLINDYAGGIYNWKLKATGGQFYKAAEVPVYGMTLKDDMEVYCYQTGFGINPILSAHYSIGKFDIAARYEFRTALTLTNETDINTAGLAQFDDGVKSRSDIPALLAAGLNYRIMPTFRASVGYHLFFDKQANFSNDRQDKLGANTWEGLAGLEWDACNKLTLSLGTQFTVCDFGPNNEYNSDMAQSFNSWCLAGGLRYLISDRMAFDFSVFNTFFDSNTREYSDYSGAGANIPGSDEFMRSNLNFGLGLTYNF
ncbi:MAG: hypothetical protein MJY75_08195 [Bacteroidaceae bacterium]|nr:hypothetical protein [Bacteroidaceae bacterium]